MIWKFQKKEVIIGLKLNIFMKSKAIQKKECYNAYASIVISIKKECYASTMISKQANII